MSALEKGGNAFDAAVTAGLVLHLVEPHLNGPGGEAPILFWSERERAARFVNGQGAAPAAATPAEFRRLGLDLVPGIGLLGATVPGALPSWLDSSICCAISVAVTFSKSISRFSYCSWIFFASSTAR